MSLRVYRCAAVAALVAAGCKRNKPEPRRGREPRRAFIVVEVKTPGEAEAGVLKALADSFAFL